uniref:Phage portal protein n=1 Tax=Globodera pallida TaxID=36090 RepID=A0A183BXL6_GLOPA
MLETRVVLYREQVCVGAEYPGLDFSLPPDLERNVAELSTARLQSLHAQLATLRDTSNGINRAGEEAVTATAAADDNASVEGDEQPEGME